MINTLLLYSSLSPHGQTDGRTEEWQHSLRVGWRNLFSSCAVCCVSLSFWREIGSFFVVAGNFHYNRKKKIQSSVWWVHDQLRPEKKRYSRLSVGCAVLAITTSFFVVAGNFYYDWKKKIQSSVWRVCDHYYDRKKKDTIINIQFVLVQLELKLIQIR